jgi:alcohol sulfotransferase
MVVAMSWSERLWRLPLFGSRQALQEATRELQKKRHEIDTVRIHMEAQKRRLDKERLRCERLARQLQLRKTWMAPQRPLTPHRQAFENATTADEYRFATVVSYPKSGRTWFSTIYFHYARFVLGALDMVQQSLHMPDRNLPFQQLLAERAKHGRFPVCTFTHLGFSGLKPFESSEAPWPDKASSVLKRPTILIVRDPRDVVVSHYHHLRAGGGVLDPDLSLSDFVHGPWGIERIVRFMNMWASAMQASHPHVHLCTFESLKRDTAGTFSSAMAFLGPQVDSAAVTSAVEESRFDRLRDRERSNRSYAGVSLEPDAFRFRRGAVGGHTSELSTADAAYLNQVVMARLDPTFAMYRSMPTERRI